jgi:hypothetical protein
VVQLSYGLGCPNSQKEDELFVYHDIEAQRFPPEALNWIVIQEEYQFRPCAGGEKGPKLFPTEKEAWQELENLYWGHSDWEWPDDQTQEEYIL